jgi:precorrin-4 methylase
MAAESLVQMLEEIAVGLKAGDEEIYGWLRQQLKECGASEISVELAMGVIARLLPEDAQAISRQPNSTRGAGRIDARRPI